MYFISLEMVRKIHYIDSGFSFKNVQMYVYCAQKVLFSIMNQESVYSEKQRHIQMHIGTHKLQEFIYQ